MEQTESHKPFALFVVQGVSGGVAVAQPLRSVPNVQTVQVLQIKS
jgi:hypothetical protein